MVLALAEMGVIHPVISELVVRETLKNIRKKLPQSLASYYALFKKLPFQLIDPDQNALEKAIQLMNEKDAPILAAAITAEVDYLLSLDQHFLELRSGDSLGFPICTPGKFLEHFFNTQ